MKNEIAKTFDKHWKKFSGIASKVDRAEMALSETVTELSLQSYQVRAAIRFPNLSVQELSNNWK